MTAAPGAGEARLAVLQPIVTAAAGRADYPPASPKAANGWKASWPSTAKSDAQKFGSALSYARATDLPVVGKDKNGVLHRMKKRRRSADGRGDQGRILARHRLGHPPRPLGR